MKMAKLRQMPSWLSIPFVALGILVLYVPFRNQWGAEFPPWSRFELATIRIPLVLVAVALSWTAALIPLSKIKPLGAIVGIGAWIFAHHFYASLGASALIYPGLLLSGVAIQSIPRLGYFARVSIWFLVWCGAVLTLGFLAEKSGQVGAFKIFWMIHPFFAFLAGLQAFAAREQSPWLLLNPASFILPLPFSSDARFVSSADERRENWWLGAFDVVVSQFGMLALMFLIQQMHRFGAPPTWLLPIWLYIPFLIFVMSSMRLVTGLQRAYGVMTPPAADRIYLARDPSEIWIRSSARIYEFVLVHIFIPCVRRFRSPAFALLLAIVFVAFHAVLFHSLILRPLVASVFPAVAEATNYGLLLTSTASWIGMNWVLLVVTHKYWRPALLRNRSLILNIVSAVLAHLAIIFCFWFPVRFAGPKILEWLVGS